MVCLQQDAYDDVDSSCPIERQKTSFDLVCRLVDRTYPFDDKATVRDFFTRLTGLYKNLDYAPDGSPTYTSYLEQIHDLADAHSQPSAEADLASRSFP